MALLSIAEATEIAGLSRSRLQQAISANQIRAVKVEHVWLIDSESLREWIARPRPVGRPLGWRKPKNDESPKRRKRRKPNSEG